MSKKLLYWLDHLEQFIGACLLFIVFALLGISIFLRIIGHSASIYQEIIQYAFLIAILMGVCSASRVNGHIRADIITSKVSPKVRTIMELISDSLTILFLIGLFLASIPMIKNMIVFLQNLPILQIPYWTIYIMLPITCLLSSARIVQYNVIKHVLKKSPIPEENGEEA